MRRLIRAAILAYRWCLSPMLPRQCRYHPSCSAYALQAYEAYPLWQATVLTLKRIGRCHPWHPGGYDPLPEPACGLKDACPAEHSADTPT